MEKEKVRQFITKKLGMSIYRLSKEAGISFSVLYKALRGISNISPSSAAKLMRAGLKWDIVRELVSKDIRTLGDLIQKEAKGGKK